MCDDGDGDGDGISLSQSNPVQSSPIRFVCLVELVDGASESVLLISYL